ncbi:hypothetical protein D3C87_1394080 [compost metagenome]
MQLEAGISHSGVIKTTFDNFESCHLFGHEENSLTICHRSGDNVRNRLRLSSSRGSLNHEITHLSDFVDRGRL